VSSPGSESTRRVPPSISALSLIDLKHPLPRLRHTAATLMLSGGVHPKIVQDILGHAQITMTLDTYSHVLPGMQDKGVNAITETLTNTYKRVAISVK
jgi:integrase